MTDWVFCAIVDGSAPADLVAEDQHTVSFMDINTGEAADLMAATHRVCDQIRRAIDPAGLDLFVANGEVAGQTVFHVHVHSIPRSPGDSWINPWNPTAGDPDEIAGVADRLRAAANSD